MYFKIPSSVALELVPRSLDGILSEAQENLAKFPWISSVNVPEIMSVPIKSFEATRKLLAHKICATPHFRMIDRNLFELMQILETLVGEGLERVLLIGGDTPDYPAFRSSGLSTILAIREVRRAFPKLKIYAGIDPYRQSFRKELDYAFHKREAGCDGFFTQPFFSVGMLELWLEQLPDAELWFGIAPVYSDKSRVYWERRNRVVFPPNFSYDVERNASLARKLLTTIAECGQRAYLMPVRVSPSAYLAGL